MSSSINTILKNTWCNKIQSTSKRRKEMVYLSQTKFPCFTQLNTVSVAPVEHFGSYVANRASHPDLGDLALPLLAQLRQPEI